MSKKIAKKIKRDRSRVIINQPKSPDKLTSEYRAKQITVLDGLEPVRRRPAMYIGSVGPEGLHHLIWEVVDNSIDEAVAGYCNEIMVELLPENKVRVTDNGRGIPTDLHKPTGKSALEVVMTKLHAGAKFDKTVYKVSGGLHGVGVSAVNALSVWLRAEVKREGKIWVQEYKRGKPITKVKVIGKAEGTGTIITFEPDPEIFPKIEFNWQTILNHLRQQAYLTKGVRIKVFDYRKPNQTNEYQFYFEGGIVSYVRYLNRTNEPRHPNIFYLSKEKMEVIVEVSLQYTNDYKETIFSFANNINTLEGGTHLLGLRTALTRTLNSYARNHNLLKEKDENLTGEDVREGLTAVISVKIKEPQFEGQTKAKLGNTGVKPIVESLFFEAFNNFLEEHPRDAEAIIEKCILSARARQAAKSAREAVLRKGAIEGLTLPGKLADCSSRDPSRCELFIVEGDSAGGSCKMGRDRQFQAILPLRGKVLNVERARLDKILANQELKSLVITLGTNIGEQFDVSNLRYHKVIIMSDADVDGMHIRTLLLTFFYRYLRPIIEQGYLFIAQPPLYRINIGKETKYFYSEEEKDAFIQKYSKKDRPPQKFIKGFVVKKISEEAGIEGQPETRVLGINIQRYKGLGEMNPEELFITTMDSKNRILKKVTIEDAAAADEIFEILMGKNVEPRKRFIQTHARTVRNLDI
ncbi:MAG: DNA topoisomerase (ATP-hydrolyzing) subunit B [Patescibacteria group bacterium]